MKKNSTKPIQRLLILKQTFRKTASINELRKIAFFSLIKLLLKNFLSIPSIRSWKNLLFSR